ncbi:ATP-binding protein [Rheinheimera nanhaiensis]|uniref:histidine kinase n=1 Tax=Rheinheimera nanhaiensis E407-8 TaxID=562729 RepID=I1DZS7_9GAMM|nr:ATP-binding protein [Rheinheimera nanhaiensis]GAB59555.1 multi-sensor signal transduction histidine kinase [Rheinheimera nanhaiensis E407-8]
MINQGVNRTTQFLAWLGSFLLILLFGYLSWQGYQQTPSPQLLLRWLVAFLASELILLLLVREIDCLFQRLLQQAQQAEQLQQQLASRQNNNYQQALSTLNNIATSFDPDWRKQLRQALQVAADYLQLPIAIVSKIEQQDYQVLVHSAPEGLLQDGSHFALGNTYCSLTLARGTVLAIDQMSQSQHAQHPCFKTFALESYIGSAIQVDGKPFGTVSFSSATARATPFSQLECDFVSLLARWIGSSIERRQYLEAQVDAAQRLKKIASQLPGMVFQFQLKPDGSSSFPYCSEGIRDIYQLTPEQVKDDASAVFALIHPDDLAAVQDSVAASAASLSLWKTDYRVRRQDGEYIWVTGRSMPEQQPDGSVLWHGFISDLTERKRVERLKDEFVSTVSHELRTPLTAISGAIGLLHGQVFGALPEQARQMTELAQANVKKLQLLINDLLDMDKLIAGKMQFDMQPQPLLPIIQAALRDNQSYAQQYQVSYQLDADPTDIWVRVDNMRLQQVLTNLLSNAAKFSPPQAVVKVVLQQQDDTALIRVIDSGCGISDDFKPYIFSKFSQADSSDSKTKGGTGLGLAISQQLMHKMQGNIGFHSEQGKGSEFYLLLPVERITEHSEEIL